jgi:hypothetical protein
VMKIGNNKVLTAPPVMTVRCVIVGVDVCLLWCGFEFC